MSKKQTDTHLKFGQGIRVQGYKTENRQNFGLLTAKGFADSQAMYETYGNILYFKNYRNAIFQIIPAGNFEINDQLRKILENNNQQTPNVKILKARAKSEQTQFELNIQNKQKDRICFGHEVIFKHIDSGTYLSGTIRPSEGTNGAFSVEVTKNLSESLIFQLLPFRSFERLGMPIPIDSPILIKNKFNNGYLTFERAGFKDIKSGKKFDLEKKPITADDTYRIPVKTSSVQSDIYGTVTHFVDLSQEKKQVPMPWKFVLHVNEVENDELIQHDIVYFQHTANNGVLSTQGIQIVLKELKSENASELKFYECLWEIENYEQKGEHSFILRHLMSGMTLGIEKMKDDEGQNYIPKRPILIDISEGSSDNVLQDGFVELKLAKKEGGVINSKSFINISMGQSCLDIKKQTMDRQQEHQDEGKDQLFPKAKLAQMSLNEQEYEVRKLEFTLDISKHCFIIQEIDDELKKKVLFALSFHSKIIDLREDLKWGPQEAEKKVGYFRMMQVTEKIKEIKDFLKSCTRQESDLEYIHPLEMEQMICKDLGISELLFQLLFYMKENLKETAQQPVSIFKTKHNELEKFLQLYNVIYEVITELIRDNKMFKIHISKWIMFILDDVIEKNEESHLGLIKELLKNNEFIVDNFVSDKLIQYLSHQMIDRKFNYIFHEKKYIEIFRLFCIVGGKVNTENQIKVLNHFIKELRIKEQGPLYQINLSKKDEIVSTEAAIDKNIAKKRRFGDYYKICKEEYESAWYYFVEYLNLIADMTKGRNKTVESYIQTMMTLDVLSELFENHELHEAEVPVIRLLHYLYAESERFYPIERKKRIVDYEKLQSEQITVLSTSSEVKPWNPPINRVLSCLMKKLESFGPIVPSEMSKNINLYHILDFIWQTLNLGFYKEKNEVRKILEDVLKVLQPHEGIDYNQAKVESKENVLMIQCKLQCMNIIQVILDYDIDLSVRYLCKHFQNFTVPPRNKKIEITKMMDIQVDNQLARKFISSFPNSEQPLVKTSVIGEMIELSRYNNPNLTSQSISIIQRVLLSKSKALENFYQQIFICGEERRKLTNFIEERKRKFFTLEDQTLTNVSMKNQEGNYVIVYRDDKDSGIMQDLYMISQLIRYENSVLNIRQVQTLDSSKSYNQLGTNKLINFTSERTSSDLMKQNVLNAENIHWKVLQYILNCKQIPVNDLAIKLLHLSYRFLVGLIWNYQDIKLELMPFTPYIRHHINANVGCIDFLREMYDNNKNLLFNEVEITRLIKEICQVMEGQPINSFYKSKLLDFFRFLIYCNGKSLKFNQIQILKIMQDDSFTSIILKVDLNEIRVLVDKYIESNRQTEEKFKFTVAMDPKLVYYATYFQILESLIDDNNTVNMGKLLKKFPFDFLVECIRACKTCWPLKRNIRAFLNRLYYFQPEIETYMKTIINEEVENVIQDLNYYIDIKCKSNVQDFENQVFENPVRFTYLESYLYLNLEENLFTLYELTTRKVIEEEMKNFLHSLNSQNNDGPYNIIRICERLGFIKNYFADKKNVYSNSFIKFLLAKFKKIISEFDDSIYLPGMNGFSGMNRAPTKPEKEEARVYLIDKIMTGQISTFYVQGTEEPNKILPLVYQIPDKQLGTKDDKQPNKKKLINKLREILKRKKKQFKTFDDEIQYKMNRIITAIKLSSDASEMLNQDYNSKLQPYSSEESIFHYITIIIEMNSSNSEALPQNEKKFFLHLITGIVEQNNKRPASSPEAESEALKSLDEWDADDWKHSRSQIQKIQIKLKNCKLGKFITELLKENIYDNIEFANAILLCGIAYMLGGNNITQKNIIEELQADELNKVMKNIDLLIAKLGKFILKNIDDGSIKEDNDNTFSTTTIDNYDFYDLNTKYVLRKNVFEPITTDEEIYYKLCVITYRRAFKFLQLLCENNNIEGKNFIREQPEKVRQANFINITTKELRNLFQVMNNEIADVPMFLLDFLLEVTQIPVKANQEALMSLTFFEDICQMENFFSKDGNIEKRGFDNAPQLLDAVYEKSLEIILSNFEGNDVKTFEAVDGKLQPKFLINILNHKLDGLNVKTKEEMLKYIDKNCEMIFQNDMVSILNIITIFLKLKDTLGEENSRVYTSYSKVKSENESLFELLESLLINIEISDEYGKLQTVLFPRFPVFNSLSSNLRDYVMGVVERDSHRDKIVSLLGYTRGVQEKIESSYMLQKNQNISEKNMNTSFNLSAVMSIVLCVYMMKFYDVIIEYGEADFTSGRLIGLGRFFLSLIQLSMALVYAYYWYKLRIWEKPQRKSRENTEEPAEEASDDSSSVPGNVSYFGGLIDKIKTSTGVVGNDPDATKIYKSPDFYRLAMYVSVSVIGTFFYPPLFFIHIIDIFCNNPDLGNIFAAIALSIESILYVSFLGIVFVFIFCTVTFSNYMKDVYSQGESENEMCETIFDCLMQLFVSGAIGETMAEFQIFRFTYDMIYITFFGLLFGNIVSGIMLDAFASLRTHNEDLLTDKKNTCYICNVARKDLEQQGLSFQQHTMQKHFLWNYVFYIYSLEKKSQTDYTGLEYYISTRYNRPDEEVDISWVPLADDAEFDSTQKLKDLIALVSDQNAKITDNVVQIEGIIKEFNEIAQEYMM